MAEMPYIPRLWAMIDAAQQKLEPSRDQIGAWERTSDMLAGHATRLEQCRAQLAALWPPEQNEASAAYMVELDRLIDASRETSTAAQNNATQIHHVADAIEQAREKLKPIYDEYLKNEAQLADYQRQVEQAGNVGGAIGSGAPFGLGALGRVAGDFVGEKGMQALTDPPVSAGQQAALIKLATEVKTEVDRAADDGRVNVRPPKEYVPPDPGSSDRDPPPPPPPRPPTVNPPPRRRGGTEDDRPGYIEGTSPSDFVMEITPTPTGQTDDGPSLTGVAPPTTLPGPTLPPGPPVAPPPPPGIGPVPTPLPPGIIGSPGPGGGGGGIPRGTPPGLSRLGGPGPSGLSTGVPPGGVIGNRPGGAGVGIPGGVGGAGVGGAPRANPVGGVIGSSGAPTAGRTGGPGAGGRTGGVGGTSGMIGGQRGRQAGDEKDPRHWDPDNPWAVEEGVAPEIEPNRQVGRHEPGSGVIGKDR